MQNLRLLVSLFVVFVHSVLLKADFSPEETAQLLRKANGDLTAEYGFLDINESCYLVVGDSFIVVPQGRHYMFSFTKERGSFIRIDRSLFHGHNFGRHLFLYEDDIYAFGGYGFWQTHGKLMRFSRNTREWELVILKGTPPTGLPAVSVVRGDTLYAFYTVEKHPELNTDSVAKRAYLIDLRTKTSSEFDIRNHKSFDFYRPSWNNQNTQFAIFGNHGSIWHILDKENLKLYTAHTTPLLFKQSPSATGNSLDSHFIVVQGDDLFVYMKNSEVMQYSINEILELYCTSEDILPLMQPIDRSVKRSDFSIIWVILIFTLCLTVLAWLIGLGIKYVRRTGENRWTETYEMMKNEPYYAEIRTLQPGDYSESEIDIALRIRHLNRAVRKLKRSTYLFELNRMQPGFITVNIAGGMFKSSTYTINKLS